MIRDREHKHGTLANIIILVFAVCLIGGIINAVIFFGGKILEWIR